ncbi:DUF4157 domain-containing protein [Flavisolibacter nicotianae]|uniref:DUF4157 domain-containing protein n=1 Tax=Flavisolibacter nicotianae TaxID=2364882 RepID=UPI001F08C597|nr:DUF4157 domain-containing protein [Flavisolibacter nicotianae]
MKIRIREGTLVARLAARKLNAKSVAIVVGQTIHLWNVRRDDFLQCPSWVRHEVEHVRQFRRYGFLRFTVLYLWESLRRGYRNNRFEAEARAAENALPDPAGIEFL